MATQPAVDRAPSQPAYPAVGAAPQAEAPAGPAAIKPGYDPRLTNEDLAPLREQRWGTYNIFAFWMSDVHSVGGYVTAGSLFALGLAGWQVLVALLVGISSSTCSATSSPSRRRRPGCPYPVINRGVFGVKGANIPAIVRGLIAIAWYGCRPSSLAGARHRLAQAVPRPDAVRGAADYGFLGLSAARLGQLRVPVGPPGGSSSGGEWSRSAGSSTVRAGRLRRDVPARGYMMQGRLHINLDLSTSRA